MLINWGGNLIKDLLESLEDAHFSDVKIEACDGEILANRTVLSMSYSVPCLIRTPLRSAGERSEQDAPP